MGARSCSSRAGRRVRSARALLAPCAGLLLTGGGDVSPELYDGELGAGHDEVDRLRDAFELALLADATKLGLPVLAICHGMQLLNVARGGSLLQRLPPAVADRHGTSAAWTRAPRPARATAAAWRRRRER